MASLWDAVTGADRKNASAEQLKREAAKQAAEDAARKATATEEAAKRDAQRKVNEITFKRGGVVPKKSAVKIAAKKVVSKPKSRR